MAFVQYLRYTFGVASLKEEDFSHIRQMLMTGALTVAGVAFVVATLTGKIAPWTGRFYSMLDPTYAKNHIPIIASVSEHQPTAWSSYYFDLQFLVFMFPVGLYFCFKNLTNENIFIILYGVTSIYFSGVMVRLMLVLAPVACVLSGIAVSGVLRSFIPNLEIGAFSWSGTNLGVWLLVCPGLFRCLSHESRRRVTFGKEGYIFPLSCCHTEKLRPLS